MHFLFAGALTASLPFLAQLSSASPVLVPVPVSVSGSPDLVLRRDAVLSVSENYLVVQRPIWYGHSPVPHEGEVLYPYSTGQGTNLAVFSTNRELGVKSFITNATTVQFDEDASAYVNNFTLQVPSSNVSGIVPVTIDATEPGTTGFGYDIGPQPGLWTLDVAGFSGWLACDTELGITQLFASIKVGDPVMTPSNCVVINVGKGN